MFDYSAIRQKQKKPRNAFTPEFGCAWPRNFLVLLLTSKADAKDKTLKTKSGCLMPRYIFIANYMQR